MQVEIRVDDARTNTQHHVSGQSTLWDHSIRVKYMRPSSDQQIQTVARSHGVDKYKLLYLLEKHRVTSDIRGLRGMLDSRVYGRIQIKGETQANPDRDAGQAAHLHYHLMCAVGASGSLVTNYIDVGGGDGGITLELGKMMGAKNIHVCDPKYTVDNQRTGVRACPDLTVLEASTYDLATCIFSIHHFGNLVAMLTQIARIVKPGGLLFIKEHDCWNAIDAMMVDIEHGLFMTANSETITDNHTLHFKNHVGWAQTLRAVGFELVHMSYFCGPREEVTATRAFCALFRRESSK